MPPQTIIDLVDAFDRNLESYRSPQYKEAEVRREFIDPFFDALGWDVQNKRKYAENYKDVVHEPSLEEEFGSRAPDYSFQPGGQLKFYVEAKKPAVNLDRDPGPAHQLRMYGWTKQLPLSILTNFAEFAVYDCRVEPKSADNPAVARLQYLSFPDYPARWDELVALFSPEAVFKGSFDRFAEARKKRGAAPFDQRFLDDMEDWRKRLAENIALRNPKLSQRDLNYAVQQTIDRTIFLRICEARGIEPFGRLRALADLPDIYPHLVEYFRAADDAYNSGLFHFRREHGRELPDELTPSLFIDDSVLKYIIKQLYWPARPYAFEVVPADILGQVYERFLGKVIHLTPGHRARVEDKPEVKKAGGVYYTPTYIVDYIVNNTVGRLLEGKTPKQAAKLRILDPACGSGSFLLGAYDCLLNWYRDQYVKDGPEKHKKQLYQTPGGWKLAISEKKQILLNNIFGVDIDPQAVEVTKLSLLLKVLEGESEQSVKPRLIKEPALPDLDNNIKCGNSLIAPDFYQNEQMQLLPEDKRYRVNVFDWNDQFEGSRFDVVIGNPPYIRVRTFKEFYPEEAAYLEAQYVCAHHVWDVYLLFLEKALQLTLEGGRFSFIVPIQTLHQPNCRSLRELLLRNSAIKSIVDLSRLRVFQDAIVKNCILVCARQPSDENHIALRAPTTSSELFQEADREWKQSTALGNPGLSLKLDLLSPKRDLCEKLRRRSWALDDLCYVTFGLRSCAPGKGRGGKDRLIVDGPNYDSARPYLEGRDIGRYALRPTGRFIRYLPEKMYSPRTPDLFETKKIVSQTMLSRTRIVATLDESKFYVEQSLVCIVPHGVADDMIPVADVPLEFILGVVNSRLESFYFATYIIDYSLGGGLIHATPGSQGRFIIPKADAEQMSQVTSQVKRILSLQQSLGKAKVDHDRIALQRQIDALDRRIDQLVYGLYRLTNEEIAIIEGQNHFAAVAARER